MWAINYMLFIFRNFAFISVLLVTLLAQGSSFKSEIHSERKAGNLSYNLKGKIHIVLLGASIGKRWNISSLPDRIGNSDYWFEYIGSSGFDKSDKLIEILSRKKSKPNAIIIKECAAYFPGDLNLYKKLIKKWIKQCQEKNVMPIIATVLPITRLNFFKQFLIDIIKKRNPFRYGYFFKNNRIKSIIEFNDWIKMYCHKNNLFIVDLETAVRYSEKNRFLREDYAKIDGLHLNKKAYKVLDQALICALEDVEWN